jgi:hypothetical protein
LAWLTATHEGFEPRTIQLDGAQLTVGLDPKCDCVLPDEGHYVSRLHCTLERKGGAWWIYDNVSRNGVFVNGERIASRSKLYDGDVIRIVDWELKLSDPTSTMIFPEDEPQAAVGPTLRYSSTVMRLLVNGAELDVPLSRLERTTLNQLAEKAGQVCTYEELIQALWDGGGGETAVHGVVRRLRSKIELDPAHPVFIVSVPGFGYRLETDPPVADAKSD